MAADSRVCRAMLPLDDSKQLALRRGVESAVQHPNTPEGKLRWRGELQEWGSKHGISSLFSELTIVPLKPGTALTCTYECFQCGMKSHGKDVPCPNPKSIPDVESDWRYWCQRYLGAVRAPRVNVVHVGLIFDGMEDDSENGEGSNL